ncbi:MBL fold metallo-hydrolase [Cohnella fermenti]|nr:MBL fold metallo-hydrolase [Cohnella fermenti]
MNSLLCEIQGLTVDPGRLAVWSLGQAGYACKLPTGRVVLIDPYVTDYCGRQLGSAFKRLYPSPIGPGELARLPIAAYLMTHHHEDHLDADCIRELLEEDFPFYGPPETVRRLRELGVDEKRCHSLAEGGGATLRDCAIRAVHADHGELAPDAIGIIIQSERKIVYHMGDTCLREERLRDSVADTRVDLLIAPINGKYGNMNEVEAARAVQIANPAFAAPCHFWLLPGNSGGDPLRFMEAVTEWAPRTTPFLFRQGEMLLL